MATKLRRPKDPRYILDGQDLYIHIDDLLVGMSSVSRVETLERAVAALSGWKTMRLASRAQAQLKRKKR